MQTTHSRTGIGWDEVAELLARLVEKSIVSYDDASGRYRLLDTVREYAAEAMEATDEVDGVRERHLAEYLALAKRAEDGLIGEEQEQWLQRLEREHDNFRTALAWCSQPDAPPERVEAGQRLAAALWRFWDTHGYYEEARARLAVLISRDDRPTRARAQALDTAGRLAYYQGEFVESRRLLMKAADLFRELGDRVAEHHAIHGYAMAEGNTGDRSRIRSLFEQCLTVFREHGDLQGLARALNGLGFEALGVGDHERARPFLEEALSVRRRLRDLQGETIVTYYLGVCAARRGEFQNAKQLLQSSVAVDRRIGYRRGLSNSLTHVAAVHLALGEVSLARENLTEGTQECLALRDQASIVSTLGPWAWLARTAADAEAEATLLYAYQEHLHMTGLFPNAVPPPSEEKLRNLGEEYRQAADLGRSMTPEEAARFALERLAG